MALLPPLTSIKSEYPPTSLPLMPTDHEHNGERGGGGRGEKRKKERKKKEKEEERRGKTELSRRHILILLPLAIPVPSLKARTHELSGPKQAENSEKTHDQAPANQPYGAS